MSTPETITKFDWKAIESAPKNYPMRIISGKFYYHGNPNGAGLSVPTALSIEQGWGIGESIHILGSALKPLPDKLDITYFSYTEDTFYQGSFDLPYQEILRLFTEGVVRNQEDPPYRYIMVGVAPGGAVAVWISSTGIKEVFFGQAQKIELDFEKAMNTPITKRAERVNAKVEHYVAPDILASIRKDGIDFAQWSRYRTQYQWLPTFVAEHLPVEVGMSFLNGESARIPFPLSTDFTSSMHPIPIDAFFSYAINGKGIEYLYNITYNQAEMEEVFVHFGKQLLPFQLEFDPGVPIQQTQIRVRNEKEIIALKKFSIEQIN